MAYQSVAMRAPQWAAMLARSSAGGRAGSLVGWMVAQRADSLPRVCPFLPIYMQSNALCFYCLFLSHLRPLRRYAHLCADVFGFLSCLPEVKIILASLYVL
jgi:hypothetical protein